MDDQIFKARAEYSVIHSYQADGYPLMRICSPDTWQPCSAREVAMHAIDGLDAGHTTAESWVSFPGGWPRFLDMFEAAAHAAKIEQGQSVVDKFSLTMADNILKEGNNG